MYIFQLWAQVYCEGLVDPTNKTSDQGMHKAAAWNMPLVIGVAKTEQDSGVGAWLSAARDFQFNVV